VSNVRCLFRIASNIGRRKVDATGRIFNEKELGVGEASPLCYFRQ
jgi:hypothetical protein